MKLIVGLGNPGPEYSDTRHNIGFRVAEELARRHNVKFRRGANARTAKIGKEVLLAEPTTFMNLSGWAVRHLLSYYKITHPELLVVVDDADLPLGRLRIRERGSAGGHNGLKSIIEQLGTDEFPRLRIGVGRSPWVEDLRDHVLSRFQPEEEDRIELAVKQAADAADVFVTDGIHNVMNRFNVETVGTSTGREPEA